MKPLPYQTGMKKTTPPEELLRLYQDHLTTLGRSGFTIMAYRSNLKLFQAWYQENATRRTVNLTTVKEVDLLAYRHYLQYEKRHKTATINQHVAALRSFFSFLYQKNLSKTLMTKHLTPLSKPYLRAPDPPTQKQMLKLFRMVDTTTDRGKRDFAIIQLFVQCGLRLSEVASIEVADITLKERKGWLRVVGGKGEQPRDVHLNRSVRHALNAYLQVRPVLRDIKKLFISQLHRPLSRRSIAYLTKTYLEAAGMPELSCHDLRHLFATNLYNGHKDILLVKEALGHKTLTSTLRYSHKTDAEIAAAMEESPLNIYRRES
jgi:integrase/recombinase XerD